MTPGLRDFVLDGGEEGTGRGSVEAVLAALGPAFTVAEERGVPGVRRLTWLDTFDWRLHRAGLVLAHEQAARGGRGNRTGRLLLTRDDGELLAEQPAPGGQPRRPCLDLPAGPVRDQIAGLISPRALLPIARAVSTVTVTRLLNADGKTVARLVADAIRVTADTGDVDLPARLAIAEVRGYPGQARKAARLLAAATGVSPASSSAFDAALRALGRRPDDYSGGVDAKISAGMPAAVAVATILLRLLDTLEQNTGGVLGDIDTEFLHDLRVSVRRTRSAIKLLGDVLPAGLAGQYAAEFKWLGDLTTPTRDLDVHLLGFDEMAGRLIAASPADLEPFRAFLVRRRAREFRRLAAAIRSLRFRTITEHWRKALVEVRDVNASSRKSPTAAALAASRTGRAYRRMLSQGRAITPDSAPESLHNLRKRGKELRYLLEFFAPLHDPVAYKKAVSDLKQLQDCLGEFQDSQVQRDEIHALADAMLAERAAPAATLLAMGELVAGLAASQAEARAAFSRRFARFAGPDGQQRATALLAGPAGPKAGR